MFRVNRLTKQLDDLRRKSASTSNASLNTSSQSTGQPHVAGSAAGMIPPLSPLMKPIMSLSHDSTQEEEMRRLRVKLNKMETDMEKKSDQYQKEIARLQAEIGK